MTTPLLRAVRPLSTLPSVVVAVLVVVLAMAVVLYAPAPARAAPGIDVMPAVSIGQPTVSDDGGVFGDMFDPGPGLSLSLGARLHPMFSLDLQLGYDKPGTDDPAPGLVTLSAHVLQGQLVPAFHVASDGLDFSMGPSLGLFYLRVNADARVPMADDEAGHIGLRGFTLGVRAALMVRVAPSLSLGPLLSFEKLWVTRGCVSTEGASYCVDDPEDDVVDGYWNVGLALLF
jgi:hypothetical protein